ncbi:hypothetical protein ACOSQ2_005932 [Xanthoceras sorbifolium]
MESLREVLKHPAELYYLVKLKMALRGAEKHIPPEPHWAFCYTMVYKFLRNALIFQQFETKIRDTIATTDDYDEYCHYSAELVEIGLFKLFNSSRKQDPIMEKLCGSTFIFYQKRDMIEDYLEDINEIPKPRIFWPREIYSKYVDKVEDLKCEENSVKAVQCLNEMVTNALKHAGDCLNHLSTLNDDAALQFFGALAVKGMGTLVLCYNNIQVFKDKVRLRRGLAARLYEQTKTMSDIYNVFFEFAYVMKSKVEMHDPNAMKTLSELNKIQEICRKSGLLNTSWINPASASAQIPECGRRGVVSLSLLGSMCDGCLNGCRATWVCEVWLFIESHDRLYLDRRTLIVGGSSCDHYHWAREAFQLSKNNSHLFYLLQKLKMALRGAEKHIPTEPHWAFCHTMVYKFLRNALIFQQFETKIRDAVCVFYLVLRVLDTIEDDTSIPTEVKVPMLIDFYRCTRNLDKVVVDEFHHVSTAFMELEKGHRETIVDFTKRMGAGMAKFICKEKGTTDDYDEYCHYSAELVEIGLFKLFNPSRKQDPHLEKLCGSTFIFYQKRDMIEDYLEDINEIPKPRIFWPREIYSKYVDNIKDLKCEENSIKAVQCLNEMVTDALKHAGDCLNHLSTLNDDAALQFFGALAVKGMGTLVLCYNNIQVFKDKVRLRRGKIYYFSFAVRLYEQTKTMSDIYNVFFEFASVMKSKVEMHDPNAMKTLTELNKIQEICRKSGLLNTRKFYIINSEQGYNSYLMTTLFILLFIIFGYLSTKQQNKYCKFCYRNRYVILESF